jgi:hypothetical protein
VIGDLAREGLTQENAARPPTFRHGCNRSHSVWPLA